MIIFCIIFSKDKLIFKINFKEKINKKYLAYYFFYTFKCLQINWKFIIYILNITSQKRIFFL